MPRAVLAGSGARRLFVVLVLALGSPAGMILAGATAPASACSNSSHCYATVSNLNTATNHGAYGEINTHCEYMPNNGTFVTQEVWDVNSSAAYWEEVGIYSGAGSNISYGDRNWFWADSRPGGGFSEHDSSAQANTDTTYRVKIEFEGNGTWNIYGNGDYSHFGTSTSQSATLITNEAGTEYTNGSGSGIRDQGQVGNLQRISSSGTYYNWGANADTYDNGYITPNYSTSSSTVSWSGPC